MKNKNMLVLIPLAMIAFVLIIAATEKKEFPEKMEYSKTTITKPKDKGCVFKTVFEGEDIDSNFVYKTPAKVATSMEDALTWINKAQLKNGGWGAGTHAHQAEFDPHAVSADPATTAMVAMALLRCGNTPTSGPYAANLSLATDYLIKQVENADAQTLNITDQTGTQPQIKLGQNIDVVLTTQYFTNLMDYITNNTQLKSRVQKCLDKCVVKVQNGQAENGSTKGAGWAGVLQSSFAANALETAREAGANVDEKKLEKARDYQKQNYNTKTNQATTNDAAGVMLYSVSGSARSSAKEAAVAKDKIARAKKEGKLPQAAPVTTENLKAAGFKEEEAMKYAAAYEINQAAKMQAQRSDVMDGFGSNGGEEFLSYLQTGEGLIMSKDVEWKKWYDNVSGKLVRIQNNDGSWNGHHCITSPVFCTATSLLILSVNNDIEKLTTSNKNQNRQ